MEEKRNNNALCVVLAILMIVDCNFGERTFPLGGLEVYWHLPLMGAMVAVGAAAFLASPDLPRGAVIWENLWVLLVPALFPIVWSLMVWIAGQADLVVIRRGIVSMGYQLAAAAGMAAAVYILADRAALVWLIALLAGNFPVIIRAMAANGPGAFFSDFLTLLVTFAGETGPVMRLLEINDITYSLGMFLALFLAGRFALGKRRMLFLLTLFCFLTGLKRIAVFAVLAAAAAGLFFTAIRRMRDLESWLLKLLGTVFLLGALAYVGAVYYGVYDYLESIGFDTNARAQIYGLYHPYYRSSPAFLGNGTGWVDNMFRVWLDRAAAGEDIQAYHTHNDYLRGFIELGMIGALLWYYFRFNFQVSRAFRTQGQENGIVSLILVVYLAVNYMTDPISTMEYVNATFAVVLLSYRFGERTKKEAARMREENRRLSEPASIGPGGGA